MTDAGDPPGQDPPPGEPDEGGRQDEPATEPGDGEHEGKPPAHTPNPEEIEDPLKRETIKYLEPGQVLGVRLDGPKVGTQTIDVFLLSEFLGQLDRVVRGLTAWARGIPLAPSGRLPKVPDAAPWLSRGVMFENSATLNFVLGQPESTRISDEGGISSPTIDAVEWLESILALDASPAVEALRGIDDRIGRDFTRLVDLLADNELRSQWKALDREPVTVSRDRADRVRAVLHSESEPEASVIEISGFLYQLDAKKHDFKLQPEDGEAVTGSYDDSLVDSLRGAWRHRVVAEVTRTERRYTYATHPHKVDHALSGIVDRLEPLDD